jgi:hypothetical protein
MIRNVRNGQRDGKIDREYDRRRNGETEVNIKCTKREDWKGNKKHK